MTAWSLRRLGYPKTEPKTDTLLWPVHHSVSGSQYLSIRHSERLAEAGIEPSVGSKGDRYDNALAEMLARAES
jgi:transposase InsO family protein